MLLLDSINLAATKTHLVITYKTRESLKSWHQRAKKDYGEGNHYYGSPDGWVFYQTFSGAEKAWHAGVWDRIKERRISYLCLFPALTPLLFMLIMMKRGK